MKLLNQFGIKEKKKKVLFFQFYRKPGENKSGVEKKQTDNFNPLTSNSDQHLISPHNITPGSNIRVTRIKEMITN